MAIKNLNQFYATLRDKGVKLNHQYQMTVIPIGPDPTVVNAFTDITMFAESGILPGRTLKNAAIPYMGYELTVPTVADMTKEMELTVRCDKNMDLHKAAMQWLAYHSRLNNGVELANGGGSKSIPTSNITLFLLEDDMTTTDTIFSLNGAYPTAVGDIEVSNAAEPDVMQFSMTVTFQFWTYVSSTVGTVNTAGI